jgi:hypothetical protein
MTISFVLASSLFWLIPEEHASCAFLWQAEEVVVEDDEDDDDDDKDDDEVEGKLLCWVLNLWISA